MDFRIVMPHLLMENSISLIRIPWTEGVVCMRPAFTVLPRSLSLCLYLGPRDTISAVIGAWRRLGRHWHLALFSCPIYGRHRQPGFVVCDHGERICWFMIGTCERSISES
jgi:hypothetical protein